LSRNTPQKQAVFSPRLNWTIEKKDNQKVVDLGTMHAIVRYLDTKYNI